MDTANRVEEMIVNYKQLIADGKISKSEAGFEIALACVGWAYVFAAYGEFCDPSNRRSRYNPDHATIKTKCKNFNGADSKPAGCVGCKWFLGSATSDESKHEGRTRFFDCRGFVYFVLHCLFGMWDNCPAGCTTMWNNDSNWSKKGLIKDGVPENTLVCLFYSDKDNPKKMAHIGFGYNGETVECSSGVEYHESYNKKWTHYAVPVCISSDTPTPAPTPTPDKKPTLRVGDSGKYVSLLQAMLIQRGYPLPKYGADGRYGNETMNAVKAFQSDSGLVSDGICGQKTWEALENIEPVKHYTVSITGLTFTKAEALLSEYPWAIVTEEGR